MTLQQLLKVDEATETVTMNVWLNMEWTDELLKWDSQEYGKTMRNIRIKPKDIWTPDIEVYNKVNMKLLADTDVVVYSDGSCIFNLGYNDYLTMNVIEISLLPACVSYSYALYVFYS